MKLVTVERAIELANSLHDVELQHPGACPTCFNALSVEIEPGDDNKFPLLEDLRDNHAEFWDACMSFLTAPRTEDDLAALRGHLTENARSCRFRAEHNTVVKSNYKDIVHTLVEALYHLVLACLARGQHPLLNRATMPKGFGTHRGRWPESASKLLPRGARQSVEMHVFWCSQRFSTLPLTVLSSSLIVARGLVLPHLVAPGRPRAQFVYLLAQALHADVAAAPAGWEGAPPVAPAGSADLPLASPANRAGLLQAALHVMRALTEGLDSKAGDPHAFFAGFERAAFHATLAAARQTEPAHAAFRSLAQFLQILHGRLGLPPSSVDARVRAAWPPPAPDVKTDLGMAPYVVLLNLQQLDRTRGCTAPGCGRTVHDNGGKAFAACARCKLARYCGRDCQQRDWKAGENKHRDICPLLCRLPLQSAWDMSPEEFAAAFHGTLGIPDRLKLFRWSVTGGHLDDILAANG